MRKSRLVIYSLESSHLYLLEERSSRRDPVNIQERRIEHPITGRRIVNRSAAVFVGPVIVVGIIEIDQRSAIIQPNVPLLEEPDKVMHAAVHSGVVTPLIRSRIDRRDRAACQHRKSRSGYRVRLSIPVAKRICKAIRVGPTV